MRAAIEARAVSYHPRSGEITVRDISMTIDHGELVAIIGSRGSGKTTLLDTLSGLLSPSSGTVRRGSRDAGPPASGRVGAAGWRVGYVPDGGTIHPFFPLGRALRYSAELRGAASPGDDGDDAVEEALRVVNLAGQAPAQVADLNPGERKRAAIAAELLAGPAQLFLDEPTAGLDPAQATEVMRLLRRLADGGLTVVLTTSSSLDAARCDKVAVLAAGGHLAFFGTPAAARGYFGADSLEEIYERLAGLGDPAAAWSRRFFQFSRTRAAFPPVPTVPHAAGPAALVPDAAGPHSAGRPGLPEPEGEEEARADPEPEDSPASFSAPASPAGDHPADRHDGWLRPVRQLFVLIRQNTELTARSWLARTVLAGAPAAVLLSYGLLIGVGAFDSPAARSALIVLGGSSIGLAYGLSHDREEGGALRAERFAGLSAATYVLAKLAVLLPALAAADAVALLVPAACSRLPHGFGPSYLTVLLSSALALALALLLAVTVQGRPALAGPRAAVIAPAAIFAAALLSLLDRPAWWTWLLLAAVTAVLLAAVTVAIARRDPRPR